METEKRKRRYKFTKKKHSKRGMFALLLAAVSIGIFAAVVFLSFESKGNGSMYLGSAGVASMFISIGALILAIGSLKEEDSFKLFPYTATAMSFLATGTWITLYVVGALLAYGSMAG